MDEEELALGPIDLVEVVLRWEGMRVVYNALLLVLGVGAADILHPEWLTDQRFLFSMLEFAVLANLCFCAAPLSELVVRGLGLATPWLAVSLFLMGLLCSAFLLLASLFAREFSMLLSNQ